MNEKPNTNVDIGFIAQVPYHVYVFKNIIKHLPNAEFIVGDRFSWGEPDSVHIQKDRISTIIRLIRREHFPWRFFDLHNDRSSRAFFQKYKVFVSANTNAIIASPLAEHIRKVRVQYGYSKDLFEFGVQNRYFDLILAQGPYADKHFRLWAKSRAVGFPRFDDWFNNKVDTEITSAVRKHIDSDRKTILYLPTHGNLSSLQSYHQHFARLRSRYNVLVKFHHETVWCDPQVVQQYRNDGFVVFDDSTDILPLLKLSDIVVSDSGGAAFDALLGEKPLVIIDMPVVEKMVRQSQRIYGNIEFGESVTDAESVEQRIKLEGNRFGPVVREPRELDHALAVAENEFYTFADRRKRWRKELFSYVDGKDGERAAHEIRNLQHSDPPPRPFVRRMLDGVLDSLQQKIEYLEKELVTAREKKKRQSFFRRFFELFQSERDI